MYRILTEPVTNILRQQAELLSTEQVKLEFTEEAKREIARVASLANKTIENIGARRLHTVLERIVEELSFDASDKEPGTTITVDKEYVEVRLGAPNRGCSARAITLTWLPPGLFTGTRERHARPKRPLQVYSVRLRRPGGAGVTDAATDVL